MTRTSAGGPEVATTRLMAFTSGAFYLAGGTAAALTTVPRWEALDAPTALLLALAAVAVACGAGLLRWGRHLPRWAFHVVVGAASALLATAVVLSDGPSSALGVAAVFVFCAVDILYFFRGRQAVAQSAGLLVAVAGSLTVAGVPPTTTCALLLVQAAVIVVIGRLVARAAQGGRDSLTGLPNRRGFDERLDHAVLTARRTGTPLSVALIDVDHFKAVNDRDGHPAGDALLQRLASAWSGVLPRGMWLTRQGGDEFALLAQGHLADDVARLSDRLQELARPATISVGVAELGAGEDGAGLVRRADTALYAAKSAGRACTRTADPSEEALVADLAAAIAGGGITAALQPIVVPGSGELVGVEALARWHHPERGPVPPATFIPLAERTGQIGALGREVLTTACHDAVQLRHQLGRDVLLTVNTSCLQLIEPAFTEELLATLALTGLPRDQLVVEVTESSVEIASPAVRRTLQELRDLGVAVAIDDFGTGYSAFSHLDTLPADYLKLDAVFTSATTTSPRRAAMLRALLDLCDHLGITVVAEGVETVEQAHLLEVLGCPLAQGYLYARPAALADAPPWAVRARSLTWEDGDTSRSSSPISGTRSPSASTRRGPFSAPA